MTPSLLMRYALALMCLVALTTVTVTLVQGENEMVDAPMQLTKFEQYMAQQLAAEEDQQHSMMETEAETETETEIEGELEGDAELESETESELESDADAEDASEVESEVDGDSEADSEFDASEDETNFIEMTTEVDEAQTPAPVLVVPTIEEGTVGLPEPTPAPAASPALPPCPKSANAALLEVEDSQQPVLAAAQQPVPAAAAPAAATAPAKVHIHVATKFHGGAGSDNLIRVEERFDTLHDRVMGKLNRLMSRIKRHPESIDEKDADYAFAPTPAPAAKTAAK